MTGQNAQLLLTLMSGGVGLIGFILALIWHWKWHSGEYDWVEALARSLFIFLQGTLWGAVLGFVVIGAVFHVWYAHQ